MSSMFVRVNCSFLDVSVVDSNFCLILGFLFFVFIVFSFSLFKCSSLTQSLQCNLPDFWSGWGDFTSFCLACYVAICSLMSNIYCGMLGQAIRGRLLLILSNIWKVPVLWNDYSNHSIITSSFVSSTRYCACVYKIFSEAFLKWLYTWTDYCILFMLACEVPVYILKAQMLYKILFLLLGLEFIIYQLTYCSLSLEKKTVKKLAVIFKRGMLQIKDI